MARTFALILMIGLASAATAQEARDRDWFLRRLAAPEVLPELENAHTFLESTWDRSGGNEDGTDFKRIEGGRNVLLDVEGPGCVHRVSTALLGEAVAGTRIVILLDGAEEPACDRPVDEFFADAPLIGGTLPRHRPGPYPTRIVPIPFAESCRIELVSDLDEPRWGRYWQVAWTRYPSGTKTVSRAGPMTDAKSANLWRLAIAGASENAPGDALVRAHASKRLEPDAVLRWDVKGQGTISRLGIAVTPNRPDLLRALRLRIFWDGADEPSVDAPAGYFFGNGESLPRGTDLSMQLLEVRDTLAVIKLPMPFTQGAVIELENRAEAAIETHLFVTHEHGPVPPSHGRLHATWREERAGGGDGPTEGPLRVPVHVALDRTARGKYVGMILHVAWPFHSWWGEGDVLIWSDEEGFPPSYHGTGTEEYFTSAWCRFDTTAFAGALSERPGDVLLYTFHKNDAFQFSKRIRVALERVGQGAADESIRRHRPIWGTTAFWYADRALPAGSTPGLIPRKAHAPIVDEWSGGFEPVQRDGVVRFTTDGSDPTLTSPEWKFGRTWPGTTLRARTFHPHLPPSDVVHVEVSADFDDPVALPASPVEALEDGFRYACYDGDFTSLPMTAKLRPAKTGSTRTGRGIQEHVAARSGEGVAVRTEGHIEISATDTYLLDLNGASHARLTVDGRVLVGPGIERSSSWPPCCPITLAAGTHEVVIETLVHPRMDLLALHVTNPAGERRAVALKRRKP